MEYLNSSNIIKFSRLKRFRLPNFNFRDFRSESCKFKKSDLPRLSSKNIRKLFIDYFVNKKNHKFVNSSPVFLNNDPSLLFVNAGMNQFRSVLLNKTYPGHPFYGLKRAVNSQKCVRLSGKHNDLKDVGVDLYHHTFFEMLGNWSFGDYSKLEACKMAWDLLTNIYGLSPRNLYVTYFGGDTLLGLQPDVECLNVWLEVGVDPSHIFPFGAEDNFWEMADKGPCGPCTEIHYDFSQSGPQEVSSKINGTTSVIMEIWNLVFIQYNRDQDGTLKTIPLLNIDTGMGFERLTAVLQGTNSNYNTDIFSPIFKAIQSNFKVRPYLGKTGSLDNDGVDMAYRILADHSRMFSVAIADGMFPDRFDAGHVLKKIIRRAAYFANRVMKTRPGALSSLVPYVAETLDFFPEVGKHIEEIKYVVNEEEKLFHSTINKGRKARNRMMSDSNITVLNGKQLWELHKIHGLDENVIQDITREVDLSVDWEDYHKLQLEKQQINQKQKEGEKNVLLQIVNLLKTQNIPLTDNSFKYNYSSDINIYGVESITASILAVLHENQVISNANEGMQCVIITDKSNFYPEGGGQVSDIGVISSKEFNFEVELASSFQGYILHYGVVTKGHLNTLTDAQLHVNKEHRFCCSQNHTATHLVNAALRKILPYTAQRNSYVGPNQLTLGFSAKTYLTTTELESVENFVNHAIRQKYPVTKDNMSFEELLNYPNAVLLKGEEYPDTVSVICIGEKGSEKISVEPCCGTHVHNTCDIEHFMIIPSKAYGSSTKLISAVTGRKQVSAVMKQWSALEEQVLDLKSKVESSLSNMNLSLNAYLDLLKSIKVLLKKIQANKNVPLLRLENCKTVLEDLKRDITDIVNSLATQDINIDSTFGCKLNYSSAVSSLKSRNIKETNDSFKYGYTDTGVKTISAKLVEIFVNQKPVESVERGLQCQIVLDRTNFYSNNDDQSSDTGTIFCEDFAVCIHSVNKIDGFVFHDGFVEEGKISPGSDVNLTVNQEHRLACSQNHTALHLLNVALKKELPYFFPVSAQCDSKELQLTFTTKGNLSDSQLQRVEDFVNECISSNVKVIKKEELIESLEYIPTYKSVLIKEFKKEVPVVTIGCADSILSAEPCCGTHVSSTGEIDSFVIVSYKTNRNRGRVIRAATGKHAAKIKNDGETYHKSLSDLELYVQKCLEKPQLDYLELWDCLQEMKVAKGYHETELPLILFKNHQEKLAEITEKLTEATDDFVQAGFEKIKSEMLNVLQRFEREMFIICKLESVGDGKKILNYALQSSTDKPSLYFVKDGHKSIICSCCVPENLVSSDFSALLWINPVASLMEGRSRSLSKNPELFYSFVSNRLDRLDEAINVAEKFITTFFK